MVHVLKSRFLPAWSAIALSVWLVGCASGPKVPEVDAARVARFQASAYPASHQYEVDVRDEVRLVQGVPMRLVWAVPRVAQPVPVVLYMPGAGQDATANLPWRRALAEAGYAVVAWQPLPEDDRLPVLRLDGADRGGDGPDAPPADGMNVPGHLGGHGSERERGPERGSVPGGDSGRADLHGWAKSRFAAPQVAKRLALLSQLLGDLAEGQRRGEPGLQGVDLQRVALAGYELGARTVMLAAGEQEAGVLTPLLPGVKAWLATSPYASFEEGGLDQRFTQVKGPLLLISGDADVDPFGLVASPYLRTAPFGGMPSGEKWQLLFQAGTHEELGGDDGKRAVLDERGGGKESGRGGAPDMGGDGGGRGPGGGSGGGGGGMGRGGPGGGMGGGGDMGGGRGGRGGMPDGDQAKAAPNPTARAMRAVALPTVSMAFLDSALMGDVLAQRWMAEQAARWLSPVADLSRK